MQEKVMITDQLAKGWVTVKLEKREIYDYRSTHKKLAHREAGEKGDS